MRINRRSITLGLTVGLLAGGAGGALAATSTRTSTTGTPATKTWGGNGVWAGNGGWDRYGSGAGWSGYGGASGYGDVGATTFRGTTVRAAARYLGLTTSGLKSRRRPDTTLAELAISEHKSVAGLESAIVAAISRNVNSNTALSAGQKAAIIANAKERAGSIVDNTWPVRGGGGFGPYNSPMTRTDPRPALR